MNEYNSLIDDSYIENLLKESDKFDIREAAEHSKISNKYTEDKIIQITPIKEVLKKLNLRVVFDPSLLLKTNNCYEVAWEIVRCLPKYFSYVEGYRTYKELQDEFNTLNIKCKGFIHAWVYCPSLNLYCDQKAEFDKEELGLDLDFEYHRVLVTKKRSKHYPIIGKR